MGERQKWHELQQFKPWVLAGRNRQADEIMENNAAAATLKQLRAIAVTEHKRKVLVDVTGRIGREISRQLIFSAVRTIGTHHVQDGDAGFVGTAGQGIALASSIVVWPKSLLLPCRYLIETISNLFSCRK